MGPWLFLEACTMEGGGHPPADPDAFQAELMEYIFNHDLEGISQILYDVTLSSLEMTLSNEDLFPLLLATITGDARIVRLLLQAGCNPNQKVSGTAFSLVRLPTALHHAASNGQNDIVQRLLDALCINVNPLNADHETPLKLAVEKGHFETCRLLLKRGASVNVCDEHGDSLLHTCIKSQQWSVELFRLMLLSGVDLDILNGKNLSVAKITAYSGNIDALGVLVEAGCKLSSELGYLSGLEAAIATQAPLMEVKELLHDGVMDESLHLVARYGTLELFNAIISKRQNCIDMYNQQGESPLLISVRCQNLAVIEALLLHGCNPSLPSQHGVSPLCKATLDNNLSIVSVLVTNNANLNAGLATNSTALHKALFCGFHDIVCYLIQQGASLNMWALRLIQSHHNWHLLPLLHAAGWTQLTRTAATMLLQKPHGIPRTAVSWACENILSPSQLMVQCRTAIRHTLSAPISPKLQSLGLPLVLQDYVLLVPEAKTFQLTMGLDETLE